MVYFKFGLLCTLLVFLKTSVILKMKLKLLKAIVIFKNYFRGSSYAVAG